MLFLLLLVLLWDTFCILETKGVFRGRRPEAARGQRPAGQRGAPRGHWRTVAVLLRLSAQNFVFATKKVAAILILRSINVRHCKKHRAHWTGKWRDDQRQSENLSFFRRTLKVPPSGERLSLFRLSVLESPKSVAPTLWTSGAPTAGCRQPASVKFEISAQF
jgi:hypothetical protein